MRHIYRDGQWYYFKRRIPALYRDYYSREFIKTSLKTDSEAVAQQRAQIMNMELEKIWLHISQRGLNDSKALYQQAVHLARMSGFPYQPAQDIAQGEIENIVSRVLELRDDSAPKQEHRAQALLGGLPEVKQPISEALEEYFQFEKQNLLGRSDAQIRKWENPRKKAIANFISVCGDIAVESVTRQNILVFREWWHNRIRSEGLTANSANKDFSFLAQVMSFISDNRGLSLNMSALMAKIRFTEVAGTRRPFKTDFIKNVLLNRNELIGLNRECQLFLYAMTDTGARPSELVALNADNGDIRLDADIPYIHIRPGQNRALKTPQSERKVPLVGSSLYAFERLPGGFKHYFENADLLSNTLNKYLREHSKLPTQDHSVYSLRHSFEDRLTAVEPPDKVQAALMGHKYARPRYGDGPTLEQKKKWLDAICFDVS